MTNVIRQTFEYEGNEILLVISERIETSDVIKYPSGYMNKRLFSLPIKKNYFQIIVQEFYVSSTYDGVEIIPKLWRTS